MSSRGFIPDRAERWLAWSRSLAPPGYTARFDSQGLSEAMARHIKNGGHKNWVVVTHRYLAVGAGLPDSTAYRLLAMLERKGLLVARQRGAGTAPSRWTTGRLPRSGQAENVPDFEPFWSKCYGVGYRARSVHHALSLGWDLVETAQLLGISPRICRLEVDTLASEGLATRGARWTVTDTPVHEAASWATAQKAYAEARERAKTRTRVKSATGDPTAMMTRPLRRQSHGAGHRDLHRAD